MKDKIYGGDEPDKNHYLNQILETRKAGEKGDGPTPISLTHEELANLVALMNTKRGRVSFSQSLEKNGMGVSREELNAHLKAMQEENLRMASETRAEIRVGIADLKATFADKTKEQWKSFMTVGISLAAAIVTIIGFMIGTLKPEVKETPSSAPIVITVPSTPQQTEPAISDSAPVSPESEPVK